MPKSKADYVEQGRKAAQSGGNAPSSSPASWQERAYAEGYSSFVNPLNPQRPTKLVQLFRDQLGRHAAHWARVADATIERLTKKAERRRLAVATVAPRRRLERYDNVRRGGRELELAM